MTAIVEGDQNVGAMVLVLIGKDPFPTYVDHRQLERVGKIRKTKERTVAKTKTRTATPTRELRQKARALSVPNWEVLDRDGLLAAVTEAEDGIDQLPEDADTDADDEDEEEVEAESEDSDETEEEPEVATTTRTKKRASSNGKKAPAKKAPATKKAPAKKAATKSKTATKRAAPRPPQQPEGPNPFRPGSNLYLITEELMKGGKRSTLVKRLVPKLEYNPRTKNPRTFDAALETDKRLKIVGYLLRQSYGFGYEHGGHGGPERGPDTYIQVTPPA